MKRYFKVVRKTESVVVSSVTSTSQEMVESGLKMVESAVEFQERVESRLKVQEKAELEQDKAESEVEAAVGYEEGAKRRRESQIPEAQQMSATSDLQRSLTVLNGTLMGKAEGSGADEDSRTDPEGPESRDSIGIRGGVEGSESNGIKGGVEGSEANGNLSAEKPFKEHSAASPTANTTGNEEKASEEHTAAIPAADTSMNVEIGFEEHPAAGAATNATRNEGNASEGHLSSSPAAHTSRGQEDVSEEHPAADAAADVTNNEEIGLEEHPGAGGAADVTKGEESARGSDLDESQTALSSPLVSQTAKEQMETLRMGIPLAPQGVGHPLRFMTWNANSLIVRMKYNRAELSSFISTFDPDYIALQEVRIPAAGKKGCTVNQSEIKCDTKTSAEERKLLLDCLRKPPFDAYTVKWSLGDTKYGGTAVLFKNHFKPQAVSFSLDDGVEATLAHVPAVTQGKQVFGSHRKKLVHEKDGRAIFVLFPGLAVLNTYVPNNGFCRGCPKFDRRREWDSRVMKFLERYKRQSAGVPLIWCGDLNSCRTDADVTHPEFFQNATKPGEQPAIDPLDRGQPGFSVNEKQRFENLISVGDFCDAYRKCQPTQDWESGFTWSGNPVGMYQGKRMRVDYFLVQQRISSKIVDCQIHGKGTNYEGFIGSDHCPLTLTLSP